MTSEFHFEACRAEQLRRDLAPYLLETPLLRSQVDPELFFKAENLQVTGSFKVRPAFAQLLALSPEERRRGVVTSSSGNFAQGVAYAASRLEVSAKVVMMRSSNPVKVSGTRRLGAEVVFCDDRFEARQEQVEKIRNEEERIEIFPYDHPLAVLGNASLGAEIVEQHPKVHNIVVPISGGGLMAGVAAMVKSLEPKIRVWGVQPAGSNATYLSFKQGSPRRIEKAETIADGLQVTRTGEVTFPIIQRFVDDVVEVAEQEIRDAVRMFFLEEKLVVEPSGAVGMAAALAGRVPREQTVLLLSGGNIAPERAIELLADN